MGGLIKSLLVIFCGAATSYGTAYVLYGIERRTGLVLYGLTLWFILPIGAVLSGLLAASGYAISARLLHARPYRSLILVVLFTSIGTLFLIYWMQFAELRAAGDVASGAGAFLTFIGSSLTHTSLHFAIRGHLLGGAMPVGMGGYVLAAAQLAGFAFGGLGMFGWLFVHPYCETCDRYTKLKGNQMRHFDSAEEGRAVASAALVKAKGNDAQNAIFTHAGAGTAEEQKTSVWSSTIQLWRCPVCEKHWVLFSAKEKVKSSWKSLLEFKQTTTSMERLEIVRAGSLS